MSSGQRNRKLPSLYTGKGVDLEGVRLPKSSKGAKGKVSDIAAKHGDAGKVLAPSKPYVNTSLLQCIDIDLQKPRSLKSRFKRGLSEVVNLCEDNQVEQHFLLIRIHIDEGVTHCFLLYKGTIHVYAFTVKGADEENWVSFPDCPCLISNAKARELPFESSHVHLKEVVRSSNPTVTVEALSNLLRPDVEGWKMSLKRLTNELSIAAYDHKVRGSFSLGKPPQLGTKGAKREASKECSLSVKGLLKSAAIGGGRSKPLLDISKVPRIKADLRNPQVWKEEYSVCLDDIISQVCDKNNTVCGVPLCKTDESEPFLIVEFLVSDNTRHSFLFFKGDVGIYAFTRNGEEKWVCCEDCPCEIAGADELPYDSSYMYRKFSCCYGPGVMEEGLSHLLSSDPSQWQWALSCVGYNMSQVIRVRKLREYILEEMDDCGRVKKIPNYIRAYLEHWKHISEALTQWEEEQGTKLWDDALGEETLEATKLHTVDEAVHIMGLSLSSNMLRGFLKTSMARAKVLHFV